LHESHPSGDLGYALCTVKVDIPSAGTGTGTGTGTGGATIAVWDATIWERHPAGHWHVAVDISTPLPRAGDEYRGGRTSYGYRS
jgi:hypothetical protein